VGDLGLLAHNDVIVALSSSGIEVIEFVQLSISHKRK
jgi:D-arabinose 5-phosphate isomerase GutQ